MSKEIDNSEMLAVIYSELKKITTHLKIDRRKQGAEEAVAEPETLADKTQEPDAPKSFSHEQLEALKGIAATGCTYLAQQSDKGHADIKALLKTTTQSISEVAAKIQESAEAISAKRIPVDTEKFEQLTRHFIWQMEDKVKKVKRPSNGLKWYIIMWAITLVSGWLAAHYVHEYRDWKAQATYWYQQYEEVKKLTK